MKAHERIAATVALQCPDRVPLAPLLDHWAAPYAGITNAVLMNDSEQRFNAVLKTAQDFRWDMTFLAETANVTLLKAGVPARIKLPGIDLPENSTHQFDEIGAMTDEDFDVLEKDGIFALFSTLVPRIYPEMNIEQTLMDVDQAGREITDQALRLRAKGIEPAVGFVIPGPSFEYFCFARSVNKALLDIRKNPAKMKSAGKRFCEDILGLAIAASSQNAIQRVFIGLSRSSPVFLTSKHFEEFILPDLDFLVHGSLMQALPLCFIVTQTGRSFCITSRDFRKPSASLNLTVLRTSSKPKRYWLIIWRSWAMCPVLCWQKGQRAKCWITARDLLKP